MQKFLTLLFVFIFISFGVVWGTDRDKQSKELKNTQASLTSGKFTRDINVPRRINFQGYLEDSNGPLNGTQVMKFSIWDSQTGGSKKWPGSGTENQAVEVNNGVFNVYIGKSIPIPYDIFDGSMLYIQMQIGSDTFNRIPIASVGYSFSSKNADNAEKLGGYSASSYVKKPVTSSDIANGAVTNEKMANNAVTSSKIATGAVGNSDLASNAVTSDKIQNGEVKTNDIANQAVTYSKISPSGSSSGQVLTSTGSSVQWQTPPVGITGGGSTNYIPKFTGSTSIGNSIIYEYNSKIGIGTTSPQKKFHVQGDIRFSGLSGSGTRLVVANNLGDLSTQQFRWTLSGNNIYRTQGNVGIGTSSPQSLLHVNGKIQTKYLKMTTGASNGYVLTCTNSSGDASWQPAPGGGGWTDDGTVVRLTTSTDKVGIGTSSPQAKLEIEKSLPSGTSEDLLIIDSKNSASGSGSSISFKNSGVGYLGKIEAVDNGNWGSILRFYTNDDGQTHQLTEKLRISPNGSVGIGTTNFSAYGQTAKLAVDGYSMLGGLRINGAEWGNTIYSTNTQGLGIANSQGPIRFLTSNNERVRIVSNGRVGISNTNPQGLLHIGSDTGARLNIGSVEWIEDGGSGLLKFFGDLIPHINNSWDIGDPSIHWDDIYADDFWNVDDRKNMESIEEIKYGLKEVMKLKPISFKKKDKKEIKLGLIAQDVLPIIKEIIKTDNNVYYEKTGDLKLEKSELLSINYQELIPVLIKALQEQQNIINNLEERITKLEKMKGK